TSTPVDRTPAANASFSGGDEVRLSMPRATVRPPLPRMSVPYARPTSVKTSGVMSLPSLPRTSYARKMNGLSVTPPLHHRDRFDLDEPVGMRQRGDGDQRGGGPLLAEELFPDRHEVGA